MIVSVVKLLGKRLLGRTAGKRDFATLCGEIAQAAQGEAVVLDFAGVEVLTGSWANSALVPLYRWASDDDNNVFPLIYGIDREWRDDLRLIAEWNHHCYLLASQKKESPRSAVLIGSLESGQRSTLDAVQTFGEVTGVQLEQDIHDGVQATAWNNRLRDLFNKRLIRRERRGREQVYSRLAQEIVFDG
jgi:hypothetical protein